MHHLQAQPPHSLLSPCDNSSRTTGGSRAMTHCVLANRIASLLSLRAMALHWNCPLADPSPQQCCFPLPLPCLPDSITSDQADLSHVLPPQHSHTWLDRPSHCSDCLHSWFMTAGLEWASALQDRGHFPVICFLSLQDDFDTVFSIS